MEADVLAEQAAIESTSLHESVEKQRRRFLATVMPVRPRLHRYCARMSGSVADGEDLVQETLAQAFFSLESLKDEQRLESWLFRIAHNKCLDFLRRDARWREESVIYDDESLPEQLIIEDDVQPEPLDDALAVLVSRLPPMERACVLLKDVLDYRLREIADTVGSTVGGVKAALHRGRSKLRPFHDGARHAELAEQERRLLEEYVEVFNRRDWTALRRLIRADARVEVVEAGDFAVLDPATPYFTNYATLPWQWSLSICRVDGEPLVVHWRKYGDEWRPLSALRLWWRDGKVARIRDYVHVEYLLAHSRIADERHHDLTVALYGTPTARDAFQSGGSAPIRWWTK